MDSPDATTSTTTVTTTTKLLGIANKDIAGVTRKMRPSDDVPTCSVADMTTAEEPEEIELVSKSVVQQQMTQDDQHDAAAHRIDDLCTSTSCMSRRMTRIINRIVSLLVCLILATVVATVGAWLGGKPVNVDDVVKSVASELVGLDSNALALPLMSRRNATVQ